VITLFQCDAPTSVADLAGVEIPVPPHADPNEWTAGLPHADAGRHMNKAFKARGWRVLARNYAVSPNQANLAASFTVVGPDLRCAPGYHVSVGFMTNNEQRRALTFFYGLTEATPDGHGLVLGRVKADDKAYFQVADFGQMTDQTLNDLQQLVDGGWQRLKAARTVVLTEPERCDLTMRPCRLHPYHGRFPWGKLGYVDKVWTEMREGGAKATAWTLYRAFAAVVATNPPYSQMLQLDGIRTALTV
jgi:hypothetical protein